MQSDLLQDHNRGTNGTATLYVQRNKKNCITFTATEQIELLRFVSKGPDIIATVFYFVKIEVLQFYLFRCRYNSVNTNEIFSNIEKTKYCSLSFITMDNPNTIFEKEKLETNSTSKTKAIRGKTFGILAYIIAFIVFLY